MGEEQISFTSVCDKGANSCDSGVGDSICHVWNLSAGYCCDKTENKYIMYLVYDLNFGQKLHM